MTFTSLALSEPLQRALREKNYTTPSPIQEQTIPTVLTGRDVLGCAQTGTGKTAAFALPILERLSAHPLPRVKNTPLVLVLAPTRELASQIKESFTTYGAHLPFVSAVIFGGVGQFHQEKALQRGVDILVATPGRLLDLIKQGHVNLRQLEVLVLDEADRMLDMGFIHDVKKILAYVPRQRQTLFFSATMPPAIMELSAQMLTDPYKVMVTPESTTVEKIEQRLCHLPAPRKRDLLLHILQARTGDGLTLVFTGTKHGANRIAEGLTRSGVPSDAIHGNKSQNARERALENFRLGKVRVLVATDIAARGIDVKGISLVINYDLPKEPEAYVHRIGRTARAGAGGEAIAFCGEQDGALLRQIERTIRMSIPVDRDHPFHLEPGTRAPAGPAGGSREPRGDSRPRRPQQQQQQRRPSRGGGGGGSSSSQRRRDPGNAFAQGSSSNSSVRAFASEPSYHPSRPASAPPPAVAPARKLRGRRSRFGS